VGHKRVLTEFRLWGNHMKRTFRFLLLSIVGLLTISASAQGPYPNPINHVIVIDQENRTVDNLFGSNSPANQYYLPGLVFSTTGKAHTVAQGVKNVFTVNAVPIPLASKVNAGDSLDADDYDPDHSHKPAWLDACDAPSLTDPSNLCAMDGFNFVRAECDKGAVGCPGPAFPTYAYVQYKDVAPYFQIASQYGYANYFFQTNQGPSFPSHQFLFGGTSQPGPASGVTQPTWFVAENLKTAGPNGCIATPTSTVKQVDPSTQTEPNKIFPCFNHETMADVFAASPIPITWTYYTPGDGSLWTAPDAINSICTPGTTKKGGPICTGPYWTKGASNGYIDIDPSHILTDISKCDLKQVSWVIPTALESDHAGQTDGSGPSWVASIINAIGTQPKCGSNTVDANEVLWDHTVILITWDDWGGWYEHVIPPPLPFNAPAPTSSYAYGFRVPLLVVSAYTAAGTVNNDPLGMDFGTILKFIEGIFGLGRIPNSSGLSFADSWSNGDLLEFFDFNRPARGFSVISAPLPASSFLDPKRPIEPPDND
jgi:phospholipase C